MLTVQNKAAPLLTASPPLLLLALLLLFHLPELVLPNLLHLNVLLSTNFALMNPFQPTKNI